jgi:hypothetical protein
MIRANRPQWAGAIAAVSILVVLGYGQAAAQDHAHDSGGTFGTVHFETSCNASVQAEFDRAVAMLHSFFYPETEKAFRAIAEREPACAMAYWGVAISQRPNPLTAPFPPQLLQQGWEAIQRARAANARTQRERDWIEALAPFYEGHATIDQQTRTQRYADAMGRLHERYPADSEAAVFYALALLEAVDLSDKTYASQLKAAAILEGLQKSQPNHPGIVHYIIHAYDYAPIANKGLPAARSYAALAPSAPHALHMPSHIFSTLGMWQDAISANLAADQAARNYAASTSATAKANPASVPGRYHALDFLVNAYLQIAQDRRAKAILDERNSPGATSSGGSITAHTGFAAIPVRYALDRHAWAEAAAIPPMQTTFKQAEAIVAFGRSLGAARTGNLGQAREDLAHITRLRQALAAEGDPYWAEQIGIQEAAATAWIALAEKDTARALACDGGCGEPRRSLREARGHGEIGCRRCVNSWVRCCSRRGGRQTRCASSSGRCRPFQVGFDRLLALLTPPPDPATARPPRRTTVS